jgi:hypothetical protein
MAKPRPLIGLMAGIAAGLVASAAMAALEAGAAKLLADDGDDIPPPAKPEPSGEMVQFVVGAVMGGIYGVLTEYRPDASAGFGSAYGIATSTLLDGAIPAADPDAADDPPVGNVAAHLLFGVVLEGVRRLIGGRR